MPVTGTAGTDSKDQGNVVRIGALEYTFVNATSTNAAATANGGAGIITTESITTAATASYSLVLTNSMIAAADIVSCDVANGTNTQGAPSIATVTPAAGSCTIVVNNTHTTTALSGTLKINYMVIKSGPST